MSDFREPTKGLTSLERFHSADYDIMSISYECPHGKHYEVEVVTKDCGHRRVVHHTHVYREHWQAMYDASERLIVNPLPRDEMIDL